MNKFQNFGIVHQTHSSRYIAMVSDTKYLPRAKALIKSIQSNSPDVNICIAMINPSKEEVDDISSRGVKPFAVFKDLDSTPRGKIYKGKAENNDSPRQFSDLMSFCANYKIQFIDELLNCEEHNIKKLIMMDADSIVRKSLDKLFDSLEDCDIILRQRPGYAKHGRLMAGVMCVNNTSASKDFFAKASAKAHEIGMTKWWTDQKSLHKASSKCTGLRLHNLPSSYIDWEFRDKSHIWVGKGARKDNSRRYIGEENKYL